MSDYAKLIADFQHAVLENNPQEGAELAIPREHFSGEVQMQAYIDAYRIRLQQTVLKDYPALVDYLGEENAKNLAAGYVAGTRSRCYNLNPYSLPFAAYVQNHSGDPFAHALAQLESAILQVYLAEDSPALSPQHISEDALLSGALPTRHAFMLLALPWNAEAYLQAFRRNQDAKPEQKPIHLAICRHENTVRRIVLEQVEFELLTHISHGHSLTEAIDAMSAAHEETIATCLPHWLARWIENGFFQPLSNA